MKKLFVKDFAIGKGEKLTIISGPCVIEDKEHCLQAARELKKIFADHNINFIFKSSYDKANRSSISSFRGPGMQEGLRILKRVKDEIDLPIVSDIHHPEEAQYAQEVCDIIQIPAFLFRQTDLLVAAGETQSVINIKKGQFASPMDMKNAIEKVKSTGNENIMLTDRGSSFGYNNLVSDMRAIPIMQNLGYPVCFDASHSVQMPGSEGTETGGNREFIPTLAKSAVAAGANCIFIETHPDPSLAKCDRASVFPFSDLPKLLSELEKIYNVVRVEE